MPLIHSSSYRPPFPFQLGHLSTIYPALFRKVVLAYSRERIATPDQDFLDLDWSRVGSERLVLVLHGLEASSETPYVKGMIRQFNRQGWDGLALNFRSCSGEMNLRPRVYHSGETSDLQWVIRHIEAQKQYRELALVGFSLGGNVLLKYLGEGHDYPDLLKKAVAISAPVDLVGSALQIDKQLFNRLYRKRFMGYLNAKLQTKLKQYPGLIQLPKGRLPRNFIEFDDWFTGPIHGFEGAMDYWTRASSKPFLHQIQHPTLLINAQDDSFLSDTCYPLEIARDHPCFYLETPAHGGHVGFVPVGKKEVYWSEARAWEFVGG